LLSFWDLNFIQGKNMKLKIVAVLMALSLLFSTNATASFFTTPTTQEQILALVSKLSDDIGLMADRILVMADKIGEMADKIGEMADRIVQTEQLMADLTQNLAESSATTTPTVIISSTTQNLLDTEQVPEFILNMPAQQMLIYISSSLTMQSNTTCIVVNTPSELSLQWAELKSLATNNKIYIAVKTINENQISSLSNVLTYTTLY
jgi:TolA-binding protein